MKKIFLLLIIIFSGCGAQQFSEATERMEIIIFGIGRADAIIITTQNHAVMIDTGENRHGRAITYFMHGENITSLDYLIITHFDSDHVGGAHEIIRSIDVNKIIVPNYSRESRHMERFAAAKLDAGLEAYVLKEEIRFTLDGAEFIVNPSALEYFHFSREEDDTEEEINAFIPTGDDFSIVVSVTHGENSFLFTGDAVANRLGEILAHEEIMSTDYIFLKVPRHGRHNRRSVEFIQAISPRYAVITGFHPNDLNRYAPERPTDERVIAALESVGAEIFFTMSEGIRIICNGHEIIVAEK